MQTLQSGTKTIKIERFYKSIIILLTSNTKIWQVFLELRKLCDCNFKISTKTKTILTTWQMSTKHRMNMTVLSTEPYNCNKLNDMNLDTSNKNKISVINRKNLI